MPLDAFGKNIRPGDLVAMSFSSGKDITINCVMELKPKTVILNSGGSIRGLKTIVITEEQARQHNVDNFIGRRSVYDDVQKKWVPCEKTPEQRRDEFVNSVIEMARKIKENYNIVD